MAVQNYIAEFVGTFILIFTIGCNVLSKQSVWAGVSIGCSLMVSIYALGKVSGANFNPAVSVCLGISGNLPWKEVGIYSAVQILAGCIAGACYSGLYHEHFNLAPARPHGIGGAGLCEFLYTFMLCFVVLNTACSANGGKHQFYGLCIGFVIVAGAYGAGAVSGGCFNPAVAIGLDVGSGFPQGYSLVYTVFQLLGAACAAALTTKVIRPAWPEDTEAGMSAKLVSEFLGTYILVLTVGLNVLAKSPAGAFSIAASLMCMIYSLGDVSGANFNPAVSVALLATKNLEAKDAAMYVGVQIAGGICAAATYTGIYGGESFALGPGKGFGLGEVAIAEIFFTFVLCFVVLSVAVSPAAKQGNYTGYFGLAIGSCVTVGGCAIGAISGGSLNPAVSFGIAFGDLVGAGNAAGLVKEALAYSMFELIGAGLAAGVYMGTHGMAEKEKVDGAEA